MKRVSIKILRAVSAAVCMVGAGGLGMTGCAPKLASVGTEGLLTRSFSNYSQSTVMRSEQLVASDAPLTPSRTPVPKKETTRYGAQGASGWTGDRVERKRSQVIAPEGYTDPAAAEKNAGERAAAGQRSVGIPKVTDDRAAAGFRNMKFVNSERVRPVKSVEEEAERARQEQLQQERLRQEQLLQQQQQQQQAAVQSTRQQPVRQRPSAQQPSTRQKQPAAAASSGTSGSTGTTRTKSTASTRVSAVVPTPTKQEQRELDRRRKAEAKRLWTERQASAAAAERAAQEERRREAAASAAQAQRERQLAMAAEAEAAARAREERESAQAAKIRAEAEAAVRAREAKSAAQRERKAQKEQKARERRLASASSAESNRTAATSAPAPATATDGEGEIFASVASPTRVVSVAELQRQLQQSAAQGGEEGGRAVEDFLPGISAALSQQATAMPTAGVTSKPKPEFIRTPDEEKTVVVDGDGATAVAPPKHAFKPLETEHVKFSYYDPFGEGNNRFVVVLHEQRFCYPYRGRFLSGYGPRGRSVHTGVDIKGVKNDTVRAAFAGTVRMSKFYSGYGNCVVIRHKNGLETLYGHNNVNLVRVGDVVRAGDPIGLIGRTGRATTEHCHFEVRIQGQHINPALILDYNNMKLRSGVLAVTRQANGRILAMNRASGLAPSQGMDTEDTGTAVASAASASATKGGGGSASASASGGATPAVYTVRSGDTLWGIARRFGTTISKLCELNNLNREATLPLGKKLKIR